MATIEETREKRHKAVAEALKKKSKAEKVRRPKPLPDPIVEAKKPAVKAKKKELAKKEK